MKKSALNKDVAKEILKGKAKFLSILLMIALGAFVYVGISSSSILMKNTLEENAKKLNSSDLLVFSSFGLKNEDVNIIEKYVKDKGGSFETSPSKVFEINKDTDNYRNHKKELSEAISSNKLKNSNESKEFHDLNTFNKIKLEKVPNNIEKVKITEGNLPKEGEILVSSELKKFGYEIGDIIDVKSNEIENLPEFDYLNKSSYKISGFGISLENLMITTKANVKDSQQPFDCFGYINLSDFKTVDQIKKDENISKDDFDATTLISDIDIIRFRFDDLRKYKYTKDDEYKLKSLEIKKDLENLLKNRPKVQKETVANEIKRSIKSGETKITDAEKKLKDAKKKLVDAENDINKGEKELKTNKRKLKNSEADFYYKIRKSREKLSSKKQMLLSSKKKIENGEKELKDNKAKIEKESEKMSKFFENYNMIKDSLSKVDKSLKNIVGLEKFVNLNKEKIDAPIKFEEFLGLLKTKDSIKVDKLLKKEEIEGLKSKYDLAVKNNMNPSEVIFGFVLKSKEKLNKSKAYLSNLLKELDTKKSSLEKAKKEITINKKLLEEKEKSLSSSKKDVINGLAKVKAGKVKLNKEKKKGLKELSLNKKKIKKAENDLKNAKSELVEGKTKFKKEEEKANEKISDAKEKISDAKESLVKLKKPKYGVYDKKDTVGFYFIDDAANRMALLAFVFPPVFYLIAILVTATTVSRMVAERRSQIGILRALGYGRWDIYKKYLLYAGLAGVIGGLLGSFLAPSILGNIIFDSYAATVTLKEVEFVVSYLDIFIATMLGVISTAVIAYLQVRRLLKETPASLLKPKIDKPGKKNILEYIPFIWSRLNFTRKVTIRNLFRNPTRMFMTLIGIAGSAALIFMGLALKDSLTVTPKLQDNILTKTNIIVGYDKKYADNDLKKYNSILESKDKIKRHLPVHIEKLTKEEELLQNKQVTLIGVDNIEEFEKNYVTLLPPDSKLPRKDFDSIKGNTSIKDGAVITDRVAESLNIEKGDNVKLKTADGDIVNIKISNIVLNMSGSNIYMPKSEYEKVFKKKFDVNGDLIVLKDKSEAFKSKIIKEINDSDTAIFASSNSIEEIEVFLSGVNLIVLVIIVMSSLLALIVLYNLNNVNIGERIREISTIKVLGFSEKEVTQYIYRETILISVFAVIVGLVGGIALFKSVAKFITPDIFTLYRKPTILEYGLTVVITYAFIILTGIIIHFALKKVNIVEALKGYE